MLKISSEDVEEGMEGRGPMKGKDTQYFIAVPAQMIARSLFRDAVEGREDVRSESQAVHLAFYCLERSRIS